MRAVAAYSAGLAPALVGAACLLAWALAPGQLALAPGVAQQPLFYLALVNAVMLVVQAWQWLGYREVPVQGGEPPHIAVVVPAYNEGAAVRDSLASVLASDYPAARCELVVVDDGSSDDTWAHIAALQAAHPTRIAAIRLPANGGKAAALRAGFAATRADIAVTLDSDSVLAPGTLRALVAPLQARAQVGAVAGHVTVNRPATLLQRMLDIRLALTSDFTRAAESTYGTVFCCPGALTALRLDVVRPHLDAWLARSLRGKPVRYGEDQALTNVVLRAGLDTAYQRSAVVRTAMPRHYGKLCRMLLRWDRGFIVEGAAFLRLLPRRPGARRRVLGLASILTEALRRAWGAVAIATLPLAIAQAPHRAVLGLGVGGVAALAAACYAWRSRARWAFLYGVAYSGYALLLLGWIFPYALLSLRDSRWGTR